MPESHELASTQLPALTRSINPPQTVMPFLLFLEPGINPKESFTERLTFRFKMKFARKRSTRNAPSNRPATTWKQRITRFERLRLLRWFIVSMRGTKIVADDDDSPSTVPWLDDEEDEIRGGYNTSLMMDDDVASVYAVDGRNCGWNGQSDETDSCSTMRSSVKPGWKARFRRSLKHLKAPILSRKPLSSRSQSSSMNSASIGHPDDSSLVGVSRSVVIRNLKDEQQIECSLHLSKNNKRPSTLSKFFENQTMIELGDISAQDDSVSLGSACLAVSFDGDYPQLVLQTSSTVAEETEQEEVEERVCDDLILQASSSFFDDEDEYALNSTGAPTVKSFLPIDVNEEKCCLGASFSHPARRGVITSSSFFWKQHQQKRRHLNLRNYDQWYCSPRWLEDQIIDQVWGLIDGSGSSDSLLVPETLDKPPFPTPIETKSTDWEGSEQDMRWSFSNDDSVVSFTGILRDEVEANGSGFVTLPTPMLCCAQGGIHADGVVTDCPYDERD